MNRQSKTSWRASSLTDRNHGGILILILPIVTLIISLVLTTAVTVRLRNQSASDQIRRANARDAARSAIALSLHHLLSDTNGVDSLDEPWVSGQPLPLYDAESRINLNQASQPVWSSLLQQAASLPPDPAAELARIVVTWRDQQETPPAALEFYAAIPQLKRELLERIAPHATVHGSGLVNVNTASLPVLAILMSGNGIKRETRDRMLQTIRTARRNNLVCPSIDSDSLATLFVGPRTIPDPATAQALLNLAPQLTVSSSAFGGVATGQPDGLDFPQHHISFVFNRTTGTFVRWVE